ncbi:MAG: hypothetical protein KKG47_02815 [Proteobacteria bacterium]|nr:hypothetical protein [Pseudomonadota bacterium]MBU1737916.1 hypothetical protein [Pseudomonadota bacterium]
MSESDENNLPYGDSLWLEVWRLSAARSFKKHLIVFHKLSWLILLLILVSACSQGRRLADFSSDGCSLFPDRNLITKADWCECCFEHDTSYWKGGSKQEREEADRKLQSCILEKTGDPILADTVYNGVRFGGSPYFYNWYRWGYGWDYGRGYKPLSPEEQEEAQIKLETYFKTNKDDTCR